MGDFLSAGMERKLTVIAAASADHWVDREMPHNAASMRRGTLKSCNNKKKNIIKQKKKKKLNNCLVASRMHSGCHIGLFTALNP